MKEKLFSLNSHTLILQPSAFILAFQPALQNAKGVG
jgi:hypothetical protein